MSSYETQIICGLCNWNDQRRTCSSSRHTEKLSFTVTEMASLWRFNLSTLLTISVKIPSHLLRPGVENQGEKRESAQGFRRTFFDSNSKKTVTVKKKNTSATSPRSFRKCKWCFTFTFFTHVTVVSVCRLLLFSLKRSSPRPFKNLKSATTYTVATVFKY